MTSSVWDWGIVGGAVGRQLSGGYRQQLLDSGAGLRMRYDGVVREPAPDRLGGDRRGPRQSFRGHLRGAQRRGQCVVTHCTWRPTAGSGNLSRRYRSALPAPAVAIAGVLDQRLLGEQRLAGVGVGGARPDDADRVLGRVKTVGVLPNTAGPAGTR